MFQTKHTTKINLTAKGREFGKHLMAIVKINIYNSNKNLNMVFRWLHLENCHSLLIFVMLIKIMWVHIIDQFLHHSVSAPLIIISWCNEKHLC